MKFKMQSYKQKQSSPKECVGHTDVGFFYILEFSVLVPFLFSCVLVNTRFTLS